MDPHRRLIGISPADIESAGRLMGIHDNFIDTEVRGMDVRVSDIDPVARIIGTLPACNDPAV